MRVLGVIPARGGSKRINRKNIAELGGKPLIQWSIDTALKSKVFERVFVSTEDEEIGQLAEKSLGIGGWVRRPPELARDETPMLPVIVDFFDNHPADIIVTLQPTSPFRTVEDIKKSTELLINMKGDSVFSVTAAPQDLAFEVGWANRLRKLPNVVVPNGAIFAITGAALQKGESWFSGLAYGYSMPKEKSLDIDNLQDLEIARMLVERGGFGV